MMMMSSVCSPILVLSESWRACHLQYRAENECLNGSEVMLDCVCPYSMAHCLKFIL